MKVAGNPETLFKALGQTRKPEGDDWTNRVDDFGKGGSNGRLLRCNMPVDYTPENSDELDYSEIQIIFGNKQGWDNLAHTINGTDGLVIGDDSVTTTVNISDPLASIFHGLGFVLDRGVVVSCCR